MLSSKDVISTYSQQKQNDYVVNLYILQGKYYMHKQNVTLIDFY